MLNFTRPYVIGDTDIDLQPFYFSEHSVDINVTFKHACLNKRQIDMPISYTV